MLKTLRISFALKNTYRVNGILHSLKQIPLLKRVLPDRLYQVRGLKIFANILSVLWEIVSIFLAENVHAAQKKFNESEYWNDKSAFEELKKCFKVAPVDMVLTPPVYFDHGDRISFGKHFYANTDLTILDENYVTFGDNVFLAPHVSIYTAGHPIDKDIRNLELEYAKAVTIGDNVWIGGNVVINPGVTIGSDVVIASGSVVVKDIPSHVVAGGNPCHVIRQITDKDKNNWHTQLKEYEDDIEK